MVTGIKNYLLLIFMLSLLAFYSTICFAVSPSDVRWVGQRGPVANFQARAGALNSAATLLPYGLVSFNREGALNRIEGEIRERRDVTLRELKESDDLVIGFSVREYVHPSGQIRVTGPHKIATGDTVAEIEKKWRSSDFIAEAPPRGFLFSRSYVYYQVGNGVSLSKPLKSEYDVNKVLQRNSMKLLIEFFTLVDEGVVENRARYSDDRTMQRVNEQINEAIRILREPELFQPPQMESGPDNQEGGDGPRPEYNPDSQEKEIPIDLGKLYKHWKRGWLS